LGRPPKRSPNNILILMASSKFPTAKANGN
jgi:hypothetical protein